MIPVGEIFKNAVEEILDKPENKQDAGLPYGLASTAATISLVSGALMSFDIG